MLTLVFDTCMGRCTVALGDGAQLLASKQVDMPRGQAEALLPLVSEVLAEADSSVEALDILGVTTGPGSFTGVRIGVAAAKALSLAHDIPIRAMTTLEVVAQQAAEVIGAQDKIAVLQDARRGEVYGQYFQLDGEYAHELGAPFIMGLDEIQAQFMQSDMPLCGSGAKLVNEGLVRTDVDNELLAQALLTVCGRDRPLLKHGQLQPLYLRPPDAKLPKLSPIAALRQKILL